MDDGSAMKAADNQLKLLQEIIEQRGSRYMSGNVDRRKFDDWSISVG